MSVEPDIGNITKCWWKEVTGDVKTEDEYTSSTTDPKKFFTLSDTGEKTVYCKVAVEVNGRKEELNPIAIPVRVWEKPVVDDSPPSAQINANTVSWYDGGYVGVVGEPVRLMADVSAGNLNGNESIDKYLWDFDNDWDTVELEQPDGQIVSDTWDGANLNGTIRCKAVTNYGIESEEKTFDLKIYNSLEVDPGDSYTGRPQKPVGLEGTINTNSYPGSSFEYQWRVNSGMLDYYLLNDATQQPDYFELSPNENSKNGQLECSDLPLSDNWSVTGEFWTGGGDGADAFYIYVWANETPTSEDSDKGQYSIAYDEYQDKIQLKHAGNTLKAVPQPNLDNSEWHSFHVTFDKGKFKIYLDHNLKLEYDDGANYQDRMSNSLFGFGARTGGHNNYHRVRNMNWSTGEPVNTDGQGRSEYTWTEDGTHQVGFTATVTTSEGLVIADCQVAEVTIEAGKPTAMPGGPYRGGIAGGNFTPIQFEGNSPDFVEDEDIGHIDDWVWGFGDPMSDQLGLVGKFYEYPSDTHKNLDSIQDYIDKNDVTPKVTKIFKTADFPNTSNAFKHKDQPDGDTGLLDYFFARFTGFIQVAEPGEYQFHVASDDGFRLKIDGQTVAEFPDPRGTAETSGTYSFENAGSYPIELTFFEAGGAASLNLLWTPPGGSKKIIPENRLNSGGTARGIWNPTHTFEKAGKYDVSLRVQSEYGKWSSQKTAKAEVIDGKIAGYVRAADLRTPVRDVQITIKSSHVDLDVLAKIAEADPNLNTTSDGGIYTLTGEDGYYAIQHIPLGSYRVIANKKEGDTIHEFKVKVQATEVTLNAPEQNAVDYVDLSVFPISGRIAYSIQKNGEDVLVKDVLIKAQAVSSTNTIESLPSTTSQNADGGNYNLPLFSGKYLFKASREGHDVRIKEDTPDYDADTTLVTIDRSRTDIDFTDYTTRELTVFVEDSGGNPIAYYPDNFSNAGDAIMVSVSGQNGQAEDKPDDDEGKFVVNLNPGTYTVRIEGADPEEKEVNLTGGDDSVTMTIPVQIELSFVIPEGESTYKPRLFDSADLEKLGLEENDNPEGYMCYWPSEPRPHTYIIRATANGHPVEDFTLFAKDEVSMETEDPPEEQEISVVSDEYTEEEDRGKVEYIISGGLPKQTDDDPPLAAPKKIAFRAEAEGYEESDPLEDLVTVLGDMPVGTAAKIVSIPIVNYTVLHDPPGDGSYSYLDDALTIKGIVAGIHIKINDVEIPVYPSPWSVERKIKKFDFGKDEEDPSDKEFEDLKDEGLLEYRNSDHALGHFTYTAALEAATGALTVATGPGAYAVQLIKAGVKAAAISPVTTHTGVIQYEVSPNRHLETPSGDELADLLGPGKGDIYFGEGWTLGLQTTYRMGIECTNRENNNCTDWKLVTEQVETYQIIKRHNQYIYTTRDIENIIANLQETIDDPATTDESERTKLKEAKTTWRNLLNNNLAYEWNQDYLTEGGMHYEEHYADFDHFRENAGSDLKDDEDDYELLIFSAGPTFEYSRAISASHAVSFSTEISFDSSAEMSHELEVSTGWKPFGNGITIDIKSGGSASIGSSTSYGAEWESGRDAEQTVGFVLNDDDIGDNISTWVYSDPRWGTPIFFQDPGSYTSAPWEPGTNKAVDVTVELIEEPDNTKPFDYHDGAHYKVRIKYTGQRELENATVDFVIYAYPDLNQDNMTARFNGDAGLYGLYFFRERDTIDVEISLYPPAIDQDNANEKKYSVGIEVDFVEDAPQINRILTLKPKFADLRAPRAIVTAPYQGERVSPVFFPEDDPFDIEVVSEDTDLASIKIQIRSKQPDGVWEPWYNLTGMVWEDDVENPDVTLFDRLDRDPPRREFTFKWKEDEIKNLGVGEYGLRAIATDKAVRSDKSTGNVDLDPPSVVFLVDDSKPIVLTTIPDYQARESERIYRGELSALFTDDMRATDFDDRTFAVTDLLKGGEKVAGFVSYSPALRKAVFVPIQPFVPNGFYRVEVKTDKERDDGTIEKGLRDLAGNPLDSSFLWTFRTKDAPFEPTWSITLRATDSTSTDDNNIASVKYGAEDGEDEKDARAVPSLTDQLCLSFLNRDKIEFDRDIRPADGRLSHHWFFVICDATEGSDVTISYKPSLKLTRTTRQYQTLCLVEFDAGGQVTNKIKLNPTEAPIDDDTGEIGYVDAYTYTNGGEASRYFRLDVQKVNLVATEFQVGSSGWKFLSVPITPQRDDPFVNLGDDIDSFQLYCYDTASNGYKIYPLDIGEVSLQTGHGYFTRLDNDVEIDVGGASNQDDVELELDVEGWHAIGNPFILPVDVATLKVNDQPFVQAVSAGLVEGTLYRWKNTLDESDTYEEVTNADQLESWDGYWLKTNEAITLIIPAPEGLANAESPLPKSYDPPMAPVAKTEFSHSNTGQFNLCLALTSDFSSDLTTTLGTRQNAQIGHDGLDQSEPPTLSQTVAVYFNHSDWGDKSGRYNRDYQPILNVGEERTWKFTVYTKKPDAEMTLSWKDAIEQIPDDIMLYFRQDDGQSDWQDMRKVQSVELSSRFQSTKIKFEVRVERFEMSSLSDVQVIAGEKQVLLRWQADDNAFIENYTITRQFVVSHEAERSGVSDDYESVTYTFGPNANQFIDTDVEEEATYTYQVTVHFLSGAKLQSDFFTVTVLPVIKKTVLLQSYPNPFNPEAWIPYELEKQSHVTIEIYNVAGQLVRTLNFGTQPRGRYISKEKAAHWDGRTELGERAASGVYFYVLKAENFLATRRMVILK